MRSIHQFSENHTIADLIARPKKAGVNPTVEPRKASDSAIAGMTWVITGTLSRPRDEIAEMIIERGGKVSRSVSKKPITCSPAKKPGANSKKRRNSA